MFPTPPQELQFPSAQKYDFIIRDVTGKEVKRWSEGKMFAMMIQSETLQPGDELSFEEELLLGEVGKPLPLGCYTVEGILTATPRLSASQPLRIIPTPLK